MSSRALLIPVDEDEPARWVEVDSGANALQQLVGGYIEAIPYMDPTTREHVEHVTCYLNEEGKLDGLPSNPRATQLVGTGLFAGDDIRGPLVVCGLDESTGETTDLDPSFEARLAKVRVLPDPDETEHGERNIDFIWKLRTEGESEHTAELSCYHQKAGANPLSGRTHGSEYSAVLNPRETQATSYGSTVHVLKFGQGVVIMREATKRFSRRELESFAASALARLNTAYGRSDPRVTRWFAVASGGSL